MKQGKRIAVSADKTWRTQYRPFVKQHCYVEYVLAKRKGQMDSIFPGPESENRAICVPGVGSTTPFSTLIVDSMPDLHFLAFGQCFPRYRYEKRAGTQAGLPGFDEDQERVDNITDTSLRVVRVRYGDNTITKDRIFDYVYGVLHAADYRERFATDLAKGLPRVPLAGDFHAFADAGRALSGLHLRYERCAEYPLTLESSGDGHARPEHLRLRRRAMRFKDDEKTVLELNEHAKVTGIPSEAHEYQVNGRTPLEWFIDRYRIVQDKESGIVNDPNGWFEQPEDLIAAIRRIVHVSVETSRIIRGLPEALAEDEPRTIAGQGGRG